MSVADLTRNESEELNQILKQMLGQYLELCYWIVAIAVTMLVLPLMQIELSSVVISRLYRVLCVSIVFVIVDLLLIARLAIICHLVKKRKVVVAEMEQPAYCANVRKKNLKNRKYLMLKSLGFRVAFNIKKL